MFYFGRIFYWFGGKLDKISDIARFQSRPISKTNCIKVDDMSQTPALLYVKKIELDMHLQLLTSQK